MQFGRAVTAFQYVEKGTILHMLDPRTKITWLVGLIILSLIFSHPLYIFILFLSVLPLVWLSRVTKEWLALSKIVIPLAILIIGLNALLFPGESLLLQVTPPEIPIVGNLQVTQESLLYGVAMGLRLLVMVAAFSLFTLITHPDDLGSAITKLRVPYEVSFAITTATRFVPTLVRDIQTIIDAQKARGLELEKGNFINKIKNYIPIIIPLIVTALRRALQLAEAMEARAFGAVEKRTSLKELKYTEIDYIITIGIFLVIGMSSILCILGYGVFL